MDTEIDIKLIDPLTLESEFECDDLAHQLEMALIEMDQQLHPESTFTSKDPAWRYKATFARKYTDAKLKAVNRRRNELAQEARQERLHRRERLFVNCAKQSVDEFTFKQIWQEVDQVFEDYCASEIE